MIEIVRPQRSPSNAEAFFVAFAFAAVEVDRAVEFLDTTANIDRGSPWLEAGRAYARDELEHAIDLLSRLSAPDTAWARLRAAQASVAENRRAEADEHLAQALAFWRSVGAKRYVRAGEALLAATA